MRIIFSRVSLLVLLAIMIAAAGLLAAYLYLPAATITLAAKSQQREVTQDIFLSSHAEAADFAKFVLPARVVDRTIEETKRVERKGISQTEDFAKGSIVLINNRDEDQPLLPKTHLKHQETGRYFLTDTPVTIPPRASVAMTITAKDKGEAGNVPPGRFIIDRLPADLQSDVYGESSQELSGGISVDTPLTEDEIAQAREVLTQELLPRLKGELTADAGGAALRDDLVVIGTEEEKVSVPVGSRARDFTITLKVRGRAFTVDENDLLSLTLLALRTNHSADEEFVSYDPDSFRLQNVRADFERGEARVAGILRGTFAAKVGPTLLRAENLAGLSADEVRERFITNPAVGSVEVAFSPFWVRSVPGRPEAVNIVIKEAQD
jgi:hypothetical protein